jgi:rhodanese-related sulfurtransferase
MKTQLLILFITFFTLTSSAQNYTSFKELKNEIVSKTVPLISVKDLKKVENTKKPFLILDAREKEEYNTSHIKNAKYVGYDNFKMSAIKGVDKNTNIIIYCSVGYRSEKIGEKLKKAGFTKVMNFLGGIFDWVNSGYSVYDNSGSETQKVHAYDKSWGKWLTKGDKVYE